MGQKYHRKWFLKFVSVYGPYIQCYIINIYTIYSGIEIMVHYIWKYS
jgi:hypothetical protein